MAEAADSRRVVIVGGGLAGLLAARALRKAPVQALLLDRAEHHLFPPLLYQFSTGILSEGKIAYPLRSLLSNLELVLAEVTEIDAAGRRVLARRPLARIQFAFTSRGNTAELALIQAPKIGIHPQDGCRSRPRRAAAAPAALDGHCRG